MNIRGYGHCSDHVGETIRVAAVTKPKPPPDQLEDLLRFRRYPRWPNYDSVWWQRYRVSNRSLLQISWRISSDGCYRMGLPRVRSQAPVPRVPTVNTLLRRRVAETESPAGGCEFTRARAVRIVPLRTTATGTTDSADTSQKESGWHWMFFHAENRVILQPAAPLWMNRFRLCYQDGECNRHRVVLL